MNERTGWPKAAQRFLTLTAWLLLAGSQALGCGVSKPAADAGSDVAQGSGGKTGSGGQTGSGGTSFDLGGADINLNDLNLDGFNLDGLNLDGLKLDLNITTCPAGVKTGDTCTTSGAACTIGTNSGCICEFGKWVCAGA